MEEKAAYETDSAKQKIGQHRKASFYVKKYAMIFVGAIIAAFGLEEFLIPNNVIDGGIVGVSIMMETITGVSLGVFLVVLNIPFLFMGYKQIGKNFAIATLVAICFLAVWSEIFEPLQKVTDDPFLAAIFGGIWNIHWNQDAVVIAAIARCALIGDVVLQAPQVAVGELQVSYREHLIDFQSVVTDVSVLLEIEIAVVGVLVVDRRIQLGYAHLHSRKRVAV